jgi:hypothetical protein
MEDAMLLIILSERERFTRETCVGACAQILWESGEISRQRSKKLLTCDRGRGRGGNVRGLGSGKCWAIRGGMNRRMTLNDAALM